jgi:hypothetical protein
MAVMQGWVQDLGLFTSGALVPCCQWYQGASVLLFPSAQCLLCPPEVSHLRHPGYCTF